MLKYSAVVPDLLIVHSLTGFDAVVSYFGVGKLVALKFLKFGSYSLDLLVTSAHFDDILKQATQLM